MYDKLKFGNRIHELRKKRWEQYKASENDKNNHNRKFVYCKTQGTLAIELGVERRAVNGWETGTNSPSLENLVKLCDRLECNIDYLLGANDYAEISPIALASRFSGIAPEIIKYGKEHHEYLMCLNHFMHPDNCSALFNDITLATWKKYIIDTRLADLKSPLKETIVKAFNDYYAFTSFPNISIDTYKDFLSTAISKEFPDLNTNDNKLKELTKSYLSLNLYKKIFGEKHKINYNEFISCMADFTFEPLMQRSHLELQESKLSKLFIKLFEDYLEEV